MRRFHLERDDTLYAYRNGYELCFLAHYKICIYFKSISNQEIRLGMLVILLQGCWLRDRSGDHSGKENQGKNCHLSQRRFED